MLRTGQVRARKNDGKLFAPPATDQITGSGAMPTQGLCHDFEALVACGMTARVVERLEVIDVDHEQGKRMLLKEPEFVQGALPRFLIGRPRRRLP